MARRRESGIPLPEVLFCLLVLGLLAAAAIPSIVYSGDPQAATCTANVELLNQKIRLYARAHNGWTPADQAEFRQMIADDPGLRGSLPKCPYGEPYVFDPASGRVASHRHER
jgi:type II secretory pathway pseudopilin PulG